MYIFYNFICSCVNNCVPLHDFSYCVRTLRSLFGGVLYI
jgi:hypothetical protein